MLRALPLLLLAACTERDPSCAVQAVDLGLPPGFDAMVSEGRDVEQVRLIAQGIPEDEARRLAERCEVVSEFNVQSEFPYHVTVTCPED